NTQQVLAAMGVPPEMVVQQLAAVLDDLPVRAAKTGMLADAPVIRALADTWKRLARPAAIPLVVDPVMVATSGRRLLPADALDTLRTELLPLAAIVTPNLREAEALLDAPTGSLVSVEGMARAARRISEAFGVPVVLVKGGHLQADDASPSRVTDVVYRAADGSTTCFENPRIVSESTHGTGCTLSAAIAANLARGMPDLEAIEHAVRYVHEAICHAYPMGRGHGPVNHRYALHTLEVPRPTPCHPHPFTDYLRAQAGAQWTRYIRHPFVQQAGLGTLARSVFIFYLKQDYAYLKHYARAWALAAFKSDAFSEITTLADLALGCGRESSLHLRLCSQWGIAREEMDRVQESGTTVAYTRYINDRGMAGDLLELLAAMYPCLLGYGEAAMVQVADQQTVQAGNPYWEWISSYAHADFQSAVDRGRRMIEELARSEVLAGARLRRIARSFVDTVALEIEFWDHALQQQHQHQQQESAAC
ncbi:trifunctional hydroxymethylpyrimidine kinase/phosphomethylpyrimidine kinase/thiaminase, partial [Coemansia erecta]